MGGLIWLIVVIWIIIRVAKNTKENEKKKQAVERQPAQRQASRPNTQPGQRQASRPNTQSARRQTSRPYTQPAKQQKPQHTHGKHTNPQAASQPSILQKAKENAARQFEDDTNPAKARTKLGQLPVGDEIVKDKGLARHAHSEHTPGHETDLHNQQGVDDFDTYHLMDEVYDLIVMGYSGHLEYERDFVAEGQDMLSRMYG